MVSRAQLTAELLEQVSRDWPNTCANGWTGVVPTLNCKWPALASCCGNWNEANKCTSDRRVGVLRKPEPLPRINDPRFESGVWLT